MKKKLAALYDPYLDVLGGGEKHSLSILQALAEYGYQPLIFWDNNLSLEIRQKLRLEIKNLQFRGNIFSHRGGFLNKINQLRKIDIFIAVSDGSYFFSPAKKNFIFAMVPEKKLYPTDWWRRLKTFNYRFVSNSRFTQTKLASFGVVSRILYPYINNDYLESDSFTREKEKIILSVGRFFPQLHSKRHDLAIKAFIKLKKEIRDFSDYRLVLAGGLKEEDEGYLIRLKGMAQGHSDIIFKPNLDYQDLLSLYRRAEIYWHLTGFGIDDSRSPQLVEHLGITPLEAMATGCIVFAYRAGGIKEIVNDGKNGFTFTSLGELIGKMKLINQPEKIKKQARLFVINNFSYPVFKKKVKEIFING